MADRVTVRVSGDKELARKFKALPASVARANLLTATVAGARVMQNGIKNQVPVRRGQLRDSIDIDPTLVTKSRVAINIGPEMKMGFYGRFLELGHAIVQSKFAGFRTTRSGRIRAAKERRVVGHVAAQPFMRPGFDQSVGPAIDAIMDRARRNIERVAKS